ncbi:DUF6789 family protein [Cellulomonas sp. URHB0016]
MTGGPDVEQQTEHASRPRTVLGLVVSGAVFLSSGAALVVYILTGAPLALVLALLVVGGGAVLAATLWGDPEARRRWLTRVRVGVPVGLVATLCYDLSRWALVEVAGFSASPFVAFPLFGQALIGSGDTAGRTLVGVGFHLLNGIAFGVAYTVWFGRRPFWAGIVFALGLEAFMLAIYPGWLDLRTLREFTQISLLGHIVYGSVLGLGANRLLRRWEPAPTGARSRDAG